jgi:hypothetical protein
LSTTASEDGLSVAIMHPPPAMGALAGPELSVTWFAGFGSPTSVI